ncbi:MAG: HNH endonuclease [Cyanobacteria bacterium SID2]|nr:HNH endonuclease [Cyanobacteria bacterium SID2]MBP0003948.1 HNH endonuclease [Cyanobacteria bacterium SBC]
MPHPSSQRLMELYNEMQILLEREEKLRRETENLLQKARKVIDPRDEFNKWLRSLEGKTLKQKQYEYQDGKCAYCKETLRFEDAVVHHIIPISKLGRKANKPENFKLLHPSCNLKIGTQIIDFD